MWLDGLIYILIKDDYSEHLIGLIYRMIHKRYFHIWNGNQTSSIRFEIKEGLQQGTVNSPTLFNIFTSHILNVFNLNQNNSTNSIAYADDLIIYVAANYPETVKQTLESLVNRINNFYARWNLRVSPGKCETIFFRKPARFVTKTKRINNEKLQIQTFHPSTREKIKIPTKDTVKYLGMEIDHLTEYSKHLDT